MKLHKDRRGVAAIEFALIAPVFIVLVMGGLNYGLATFYANQLQFAAQGAAKCGATGTCPDPVAYGIEQGPDGATFTAQDAACGKQVNASFIFDLIRMFPATPISAAACYPKDKAAATTPLYPPKAEA